MIEVLRDAGLSDLLEGDRVELVADGLRFTEGPLYLGDGTLLFQDQKASKTYRVPPGGKAEAIRSDTRAANGQTFDAMGRVVFCEQDGRRVSRMGPDGSGVEVVAETWEGARLNSPNDIVAHPSGLLYFSDPPYGVKDEDREIPFQGVFALDGLGVPRKLLDDFEKPNGLAFTPDNRSLYVCDTGRYHVRIFDVGADGTLGGGRVFAEQDPGAKGGPDGIKVDREGRVYVAVALGVWVYDPAGRLLGIVALPERPSNLAWGGPGDRDLAITAVDKVYKVRFRGPGIAPPFRPGA